MLRTTRAVKPLKAITTSVRFMNSFENLAQDVSITRSGKTLIAKGTGGRSSRTGYTATVFGANGFLGSYLTAKLAKHGTTVVVPYREEMAKRHLKVTGDLGVVNFLEMDLRNLESIDEAVRHSDIVVNLIGREYETKNFNYYDVHVEGARRIAEAVKKHNIARYIHVSAFNAEIDSPSEFNHTKGLGEQVTKDIVPWATIVRPAPMFGREDKWFLDRMARSPCLVSANKFQETSNPVHVIDVAAALERICFDDSTVAQTFELYGPQKFTQKQIIDMVSETLRKEVRHIELPKALYQAYTKATQAIWWPTYSPDQVERQFLSQKIDPSAKTFNDLDLTPMELPDLMFKLIRPYRVNTFQHDVSQLENKEKTFVHILD